MALLAGGEDQASFVFAAVGGGVFAGRMGEDLLMGAPVCNVGHKCLSTGFESLDGTLTNTPKHHCLSSTVGKSLCKPSMSLFQKKACEQLCTTVLHNCQVCTTAQCLSVRPPQHCCVECYFDRQVLVGCLSTDFEPLCRSTSLIRNNAPLGP